jgi:hypothetical protein
MKKIMISACVAVLIIMGCSKNNVIEEPVPTGFQWPAGTSDYAPYTNGSTFVFEVTNAAVVDSFTYTVVKDTLIGGATYRKLQSDKPALAATYFVNYNAGVVTEIAYNFTFQGFTIPVVIPVVTQTILKENVAVNAIWTETLNVTVAPSPFPIPVTFTYTLLQKDFSKTVLNKSYSNSISVKQIIGLPPLLVSTYNLPADTQIDNFYAKGAGRIERNVVSASTSVKIKRYNVVK